MLELYDGVMMTMVVVVVVVVVVVGDSAVVLGHARITTRGRQTDVMVHKKSEY